MTTRSKVGVGIALIAVSCLLGCGYKTSPRPASATIPGEIGLLQAYAYPDRILVKWDMPQINTDGSPLKDLSGFKVYRRSHNIGEDCEDCDPVTALHANVDVQKPSNAEIREGEVTYVDASIEPNKMYYYSVSAYSLKGRDGPRSHRLVVPFEAPPPSPTGLQATAEERGVFLKWSAPERTGGVNGYRIYRADADKRGEMGPKGNTRWAETYYLDKEVERNKKYIYQVRSLRMSQGIPQESLPSPTVEAVLPETPLNGPEKVNTAATDQGIRVYWRPVDGGGEKILYNVYRSEQTGAMEKLNTAPVAVAWYDDRRPRHGRTYRYAVTAFPEGKPERESSRVISDPTKFSSQ
jgi:hypothetical protein